MRPWDAQLQELLGQGVIAGFALLDHNSARCLSTCGALQELWVDGRPAQQLRSLFQESAAAAVGPNHIDICGQQAVIVRRTDSSVYAVSRGKQLGLTAHYLPSGILVTASRKPNLLQVVAPQVESICDALRRP